MATTFQIDAKKSSIHWIGKKVTGEHNGNINIQSGYVLEENESIKSAEITIDTRSITVLDVKDKSTNEQFAGHLASDDFFSSDKYPVALYQVLAVTKVNDLKHKVDGNLTIKGISHAQSFDAEITVDNNALYVKGKVIVDRTKYDMRFRSGNFFQNLGDNLIYNDFVLDINLIATAN